MINVLVADDHAIVRKGLIQIISDTLDIKVTAEADSGEAVFDQVRSNTFDTVVLDMNLGDVSGLEVLKSVKAEYPDLPILVLSVYPENQYAVRVLRAGASGYLNKDSAPELLVKAIRRVAQGRRYVSPAVAEELLEQLDADVQGPLHKRLSDREFQVLQMIASGKTVTEIADILALSVKTVSTYRSRVLDKMNLKNNAELTHYAIKNELVM
ncbi:MAG: response regulator transcription factor [Rhodothermales bacterium]